MKRFQRPVPTPKTDETLHGVVREWLRLELRPPAAASGGGDPAKAAAERALPWLLAAAPPPRPSASFADRVMARVPLPVARDLGPAARRLVGLALLSTGASVAILGLLLLRAAERLAPRGGLTLEGLSLALADLLSLLLQGGDAVGGVAAAAGRLLEPVTAVLASPWLSGGMLLWTSVAVVLVQTLRGLLRHSAEEAARAV